MTASDRLPEPTRAPDVDDDFRGGLNPALWVAEYLPQWTTPERAREATHRGIRRLLLLAVPSPATYVLDHLTSTEKLALAASPYPSAKALVEDGRVAVAEG